MCDKDKQIIRQLQEEITLLREENERLKVRIVELERLLASYESAHTPPSLGKNVLKEILGKRFNGTIVCDGWGSYPSFLKQQQRCWAHLLRESEFMAKKFPEAIPLCESLHDLYDELNKAIKKKPPPNEKKKLWGSACQKLIDLTKQGYVEEKVRNCVGKIRNGLKLNSFLERKRLRKELYFLLVQLFFFKEKVLRNDHKLFSYLETAKFKPLPTNYYSDELNTYI